MSAPSTSGPAGVRDRAGRSRAALRARRLRRLPDRVACLVAAIAFLLTMLPVAGVIATAVERGSGLLAGRLTPAGQDGPARAASSAALHGVAVTLAQVGTASLLAVPVGALAAVWLVGRGRGRPGRLAAVLVTALSGLPTVVVGLGVLGAWVLALGRWPSGVAGTLALAVLMLPAVTHSTRRALHRVPVALREGARALGMTPWRGLVRVVLPAGGGGIASGILLAVAGVAGEAAPLVVTAAGAMPAAAGPGQGPPLALLVYGQGVRGGGIDTDRAWVAALTLLVLVGVLALTARMIGPVQDGPER
ncbi:MAG: ABC transporter permease subunit [Carbonactinosporaceae bacterium]